MSEPGYGHLDTSYQAAGGFTGIINLVDRFYGHMDTLESAQTIREMHPKNLEESKDKLARFLSGWLGGPKRYREKYGSIRLPMAHLPFPIGADERDAWLFCMEKALEDCDYAPAFKAYLMNQLAIPAERIRQVGTAKRQSS